MSVDPPLPVIVDAVACWDAAKRVVRYYARPDGGEYVEVTADEFANVARSGALDVLTDAVGRVSDVVERVKEVVEELGDFGKVMAGLSRAAAPKEEN